MFHKIDVVKFGKIHRKLTVLESFFFWFSWKFCEIFKSVLFIEHHWTTATELTKTGKGNILKTFNNNNKKKVQTQPSFKILWFICIFKAFVSIFFFFSIDTVIFIFCTNRIFLSTLLEILKNSEWPQTAKSKLKKWTACKIKRLFFCEKALRYVLLQYKDVH